MKDAGSPYDKAVIYLSYLKNCEFNCSYYPSSVIPFSLPDDAQQLATVVRSIQRNANFFYLAVN